MPICMKIETIVGDSVIKGYEQQLEVTSLDWNVAAEAILRAGSGLSTGKPSFNGLGVTLKSGMWSARLAHAAVAGTNFAKIMISTLGIDSSTNKVKVLQAITLSNARVVAYAHNAESSPTLFDSLRLVCSEIKHESPTYNSSGVQSGVNTMNWNIVVNTSSLTP